MARTTVNFTKQALEALSAGDRDRIEVYDAKVPGLMIRVTRAGAKTFAVYKRVRGVPKRVRLGTYPDMSIERARFRARERLNEISDGVDPIARKRADKARAITLEEAFDAYLASRTLKPRTVADYREAMRVTFDEWKRKPLTSITRDMVERRHRKRSAASPARANHAMRVLRAVFNHAIETLEDDDGEPIIPSNPVKRLSAIKAWNRVDRKQGVIKVHQLPAWFEAVNALEGGNATSNAETARDYLVFVLLTGLRRKEAATLRWSQVDLKVQSFTVFDTKNGDPHTLPLSDYLCNLLSRRQDCSGSEFVFETGKAPGYLTDPRWWSRKVEQSAGFPFTIHDLRRTFATVAESLDISGYAIKRLLNHRQVAGDVTAGYIVADVERLRQPMQRITDFLLTAGGVRQSAEVLSMVNVRSSS